MIHIMHSFLRAYLPFCNSLFALLLIIFSACSTVEYEEIFEARKNVYVEIGNMEEGLLLTKQLGDPIYSVDRILILPFKKTNEALPNTDDNFTPDYSSAIQMDINSFPVRSRAMSLVSSSTYKILVLGFKRTDYNIFDPTNNNRTFSLGAVSTPVSLANFHQQLTNTTVVPEFFTAVCNCYNNGTPVGQYFKPANLQNITLSGNLTRIVSGLTVQVINIPGYVTSVSLVAEQLVKAVTPIGGTPTLWQTAGDGDNRTLASQVPSAGTVSFSNLLLPTTSNHSTKLYLDLQYGTLSERYTVNVPNVTNVSFSNSITFTKNQVVNISGNYNSINLGFVLTTTIDLDDNAWDGITF